MILTKKRGVKNSDQIIREHFPMHTDSCCSLAICSNKSKCLLFMYDIKGKNQIPESYNHGALTKQRYFQHHSP